MLRFFAAFLQGLWATLGALFYLAGWLVFTAFVAAVVVFLAMTQVPSPGQPAPAASASDVAARTARLRQDIVTLTGQLRDAAHPAGQAGAAQYIEAQLRQAGYDVSRQDYAAGTGVARNLYVTIPALDNMHRRLVVVGAHYDSAPGSSGANDNATGVAVLLELARTFRQREALQADIQFVFYANGAAPYFDTQAMGSNVHARDLKDRGTDVVAMLALDSLGNYQEARHTQRYPLLAPHLPLLDYRYPDTGNFVAFMGDLHSYALLKKSAGAFQRGTTFPAEAIPVLPSTAGVRFSDHMPYVGNGYPAIVVTDTKGFRTRPTTLDTADTLDVNQLVRVTDGLQQVVAELVR